MGYIVFFIFLYTYMYYQAQYNIMIVNPKYVKRVIVCHVQNKFIFVTFGSESYTILNFGYI